MIAIINYGLGNLGSIKNMLKRVGFDSVITGDAGVIDSADKIILPGVGAFDTGMSHLNENNLLPVLEENVLVRKKKVLGICLGMQLMTQRSEEGVLPGLGWIRGEVVKFTDPQLKVPHMGWNIVASQTRNSILEKEGEVENRYYFVHSYYVRLENNDDLLGSTNYGMNFASAFQRENIFGVQFHPEKSHKFGMSLLKKFAEL